MKAFELLAIVLVALIMTIAILTGIKLDDKAQAIQQSNWHIAN